MRPRLAKLICQHPIFDMSSFNESNTVEQMILDAVENLGRTIAVEPMHDKPPGASLGGDLRPATWHYVPGLQVPRQPGDVMVESWLREALIRLNPEIAAQPDRADEVIYNLRATHSFRASRWTGPGEREFHGLVARREDDALRPQRRARLRAAGGCRPAREQPADRRAISGRIKRAR